MNRRMNRRTNLRTNLRMNLRKLVTKAAAVALGIGCLLAWSTPARADSLPLSAIPRGNPALVPASGTVRLDDVRKKEHFFVAALDKPVCLLSPEGEVGLGVLWADDSDPHPANFVVERLIEGDEPALDRILVDVNSASLLSAKVLGRSRVPLVRVETGAELTMYAYRTAKDVHVLARRGFRAPRDAFDEDPRSGQRMDCGFSHVVLRGKEDSSTLAVALAAPLPAPARWLADQGELFEYEKVKRPDVDVPSFAVNVSLSKVSRDPEPLVSVCVRTLPAVL
jgi:hypothetical protein